MPTLQGTDAFDHGFDVPADYDSVFGTPTAVTSPLYQGRLNSLEINAPGNEGVRKNFTGSPTRVWVGFPFRYDAAPDADTRVLTISSAGDLAECFLYINPSGQLYLNVGSDFSTATTGLVADTWYWIEVIFEVGTTTYQADFRVDSVDQDNASVVVASASTIDYNQLLSFTGEGTMTWWAGGYWQWGTASSMTDWQGAPPNIQTSSVVHTRAFGSPTLSREQQVAVPTADSVDNSWTDQAGGTSLFAAIDETTPSDADYIQSPVAPSTSGCRVKLGTLTDPASSVAHEIHWRTGKDFSGGPQVNMTVKLYQGGGDVLGAGTLIAQFSRNNVGAFATFVELLSGAEADAITNYGDLYLEFFANQV